MARVGSVLLGAWLLKRVLPERPAKRSVEGSAEKPTRKGARDGRGERGGAPVARSADPERAAGATGEPTRDRGRSADAPSEIPKAGWRDVALRVKREMANDNVSFLAAGVAFYAFLSIFPALAALVSIYGLVSDPADVERHMRELAGILPGEARTMIDDQLKRLAATSEGALSFGVIFGILLAVWSANKGTTGIVSALNVVYGEKEKRGFLKLNATTLVLTFGGILLVLVALAAVVGVPALLGTVGLGSVTEVLVNWLRWPVLAGMILVALAVVYRQAPSRDKPRWRWVTPGSLVATGLWILASLAFSFYVSRSNMSESYGSVGAVVILLMWLNISAFVVLLGAEINAEAEHQTARDSTAGAPKPMGRRGAFIADTVGDTP